MELANDIMAIWREDFERQLKKLGYVNAHLEKNNIGNYLDFEVGSMFRGFLMAKRNMPVIELPRPWTDEYQHRHINLQHLEIYLQSSGYKYTIKGE